MTDEIRLPLGSVDMNALHNAAMKKDDGKAIAKVLESSARKPAETAEESAVPETDVAATKAAVGSDA